MDPPISVFVLEVSEYWTNEPNNLEIALRLLPLKAQLRIKNQRFFEDQCLALANQLLMGHVLQLKTGNSWETVQHQLSFNNRGKPCYPGLSFNLSNDKESLLTIMVILKDDSYNIGIDTVNYHLATEELITILSEEVLHPEELSLLNGLQGVEKAKGFAQLWSLKESYGKYLGTGITKIDLKSLNFYSFEFLTQKDQFTWSNLSIKNKKAESLNIFTKMLDDNTIYSIITNSPIKTHNQTFIDLKAMTIKLLE